MSQLPGVTDSQFATLRAILKLILPAGSVVCAFGSRATGQFKPWSDLDLAIDCGAPLSLSLLGELAEAFAESDLPWKVDIVDRAAVGEAFAAIIDATCVPIDWHV